MAYFSGLLAQRAHSLRLPKDSMDEVDRLVLMHQSATIERAPFRRKLDFWAFSVVTALAEDLEPREGPSSRWADKFVDTRAVDVPDALADVLAVAAFHHLGSENEGIDDPVQIVEVGNCLAGAGCPVVLKHMTSRDLRVTPLDKALNLAATLRTHTQLAQAQSG